MTEQQLRALHIELWQWLYNNPSKTVREWPGWYADTGTDFLMRVVLQWQGNFACVVAGGPCLTCPLDQNVMHGCRRGYKTKAAYVRWENAGCIATRKKYAALIRDSWREVLA